MAAVIAMYSVMRLETLTWVSIIYHFGMFSFSALRVHFTSSNKQLKMNSKQIKLDADFLPTTAIFF